MNWFKQQVKTVYRLLEVEKAAALPPLTPELKDSLRTLQFHPGFQYMTSRLHFQRAELKRYLEEGFKLSEPELRHVQAGAFWAGWLERELRSLTFTPQVSPVEVSPDDADLFRQMQDNLELVGHEQA